MIIILLVFRMACESWWILQGAEVSCHPSPQHTPEYHHRYMWLSFLLLFSIVHETNSIYFVQCFRSVLLFSIIVATTSLKSPITFYTENCSKIVSDLFASKFFSVYPIHYFQMDSPQSRFWSYHFGAQNPVIFGLING